MPFKYTIYKNCMQTEIPGYFVSPNFFENSRTNKSIEKQIQKWNRYCSNLVWISEEDYNYVTRTKVVTR